MNFSRVRLLPVFLLAIQCLASAQTEQKHLTVDDIFGTNKFYGKMLRNIDWMTVDGKTNAFACLRPGDSTHVWKYDCMTGAKMKIVDADSIAVPEELKPLKIVHFILSPDASKILFTGVLHARRTKTGGNFFLYDLKEETFTELMQNDGEQSNAQFSPDGSMIGFVRANNLFVYDIESKKEIQLTHDGAEHVINGHFDWVYEEEFSIIDGWQWSPDSKKIAFWRLDESRVPEYTLYNDGPQHPVPIETRYPQPGDSNSIVKIGMIQLTRNPEPETRNTIWSDLGPSDDIYIPRIYWVPDSKSLFIERLNREQNRLDMLVADPETGATRVLFTESDDKWVDVNDDLRFTGDGFVWSSEREGYNSLYLYDMNGKVVRRLTENRWDVDKCIAVDLKRKLVYYTTPGPFPRNRYLYSVSFDAQQRTQVSTEKGWHDVAMSPDCRYYIDRYSTITQPIKQNICTSDGETVTRMGETDPAVLDGYPMGKVRFFGFKTSDNVQLNAMMIQPVGFDTLNVYPVLLYVYGGPGSQTVTNEWGGTTDLWHRMLAEKGYIIVCVDNRGTGFRGKFFKKMTYHHLGKWEANDFIETAKYLGTLRYVDKNRIGIWGWSYGGYMTALTMCLGSDYFKTGIAVAPVTHWMYYDDIYTERYMGTPATNPEGYEESSPITYASQLKGKLLIIHGTDDDNVHMQNTVSFVDALQKANNQFDLMLYPGRDHSIAGGKTRVNLFTKMTDFILRNL